MAERERNEEMDEVLAPAQRHIIKRPRLTKLLDEAEARIILLVGPAGYGKTTLAREWTAQRGRRALWYRAGTGASDVAAVARGLAQALAPLASGVERDVRELLAALSTPEDDPDAIGGMIADDLDGWPRATWLVIDEYELLGGHPSPTRLVEALVSRLGPAVLLTSRVRPSFIRPKDVLYGEAFELGRAALSMSRGEAHQVLKGTAHTPT